MRSAMHAAILLPQRGSLLWMLLLHLHVNQNSDYDDVPKGFIGLLVKF